MEDLCFAILHRDGQFPSDMSNIVGTYSNSLGIGCWSRIDVDANPGFLLMASQAGITTFPAAAIIKNGDFDTETGEVIEFLQGAFSEEQYVQWLTSLEGEGGAGGSGNTDGSSTNGGNLPGNSSVIPGGGLIGNWSLNFIPLLLLVGVVYVANKERKKKRKSNKSN